MIEEILKTLEDECNDDAVLRILYEHAAGKIKSASEEVLKNISEKGLTLSGAYEEMEDAAREKAHGAHSACLSDAEGFAIVDKYFGFAEEKPKAEKPKSLFDLI